MAQLAEKQSADLAKVKEIARRTLEQCKRREAEATDRAEKLHEELCALKVALKEARDACDAAVGASDGAFRQLRAAKIGILAGVSAVWFRHAKMKAKGA